VANIQSQIKRNRQNEKRRLRNKSVRAELRTRTKNAVSAAESGAEDTLEQLRLAVKRIDKAAARGVIHKNTAANHKSRLVRRVAAIEAAAIAAPPDKPPPRQWPAAAGRALSRPGGR
jgi:small subunit ribosomal protein S20